MEAGPLRLDLARRSIETKVRLKAVPLTTLLELLSEGRVRGEGSLTGDLNISFGVDPHLTIDIGSGLLRADSAGVLAVDDLEAARDVLDGQLGTIENLDLDDLVSERILGALRDFAYSELSFEFVPGANDLKMSVHTRGKGRTVPQELDLTVNFNGLDDLLELLMGVNVGMQRAKEALPREKTGRTP